MRIWPTKRTWLRLAIGLGMVVGIALVANAFMAWRTDQRLAAKIAAIRASGDPASISDLAPKPVPDDENAAVILRRLGPRLAEFSKQQSQFYRTPLGATWENRIYAGEPVSAEQVDAVRKILAEYPEIRDGIAAAASCDEYASVADYSMGHRDLLDHFLKSTQIMRGVARYAQWRTEVLISEGKHEEAAENGIELLRVARLHDGEPLLVNYLLGVAIRGMAADMLYDALAEGPIKPELHAAVEQELALHDTPGRFSQALKTERAYAVSIVADGQILTVVGENSPFYLQLIAWPMKRLFVNEMDYFGPQIRAIATSWPNPQGGAIEASKEPDVGMFARLAIPALQAAYNAEARIVAQLRAMRIFNALAEYREKNGREATGLDELSLPAAATIDPFGGKPLLLKRTEDAWIVYSVMSNGVDDGGDFKDLKDYGVAPRKLRVNK